MSSGRFRSITMVAAWATFGAASASAQTAGATGCEMVAKLALPQVTMASAQTVAAGQFTPPQGGRGGRGGANPFADVPAFCRVAAAAKPAPDSDIRFEVWLPASSWNGKLQTVGNGGYAGTIGYAAMATAVSAGYAAASTDTGHQGGDPAFLMASADKLTDFAHRAIHETTVAAKAVIAAYY